MTQAVRHDSMRARNLEVVLGAVSRGGPLTRAALAELTGLTKSTVSKLVGDLLDGGLLAGTGPARPAGRGGRAQRRARGGAGAGDQRRLPRGPGARPHRRGPLRRPPRAGQPGFAAAEGPGGAAGAGVGGDDR